MMKRHFHEELSELKRELIRMGQLVQESIRNSIESFFNRDDQTAIQTLQQEKRINQYEITIDDLCQRLAALNQPMASDLRMVATVFKINKDLERMGDHATNIAEFTLKLNSMPPIEANLNLKQMAEKTLAMVSSALDSFVLEDIDKAKGVLLSDDVIDQYNDQLFSKLGGLIEKDPGSAKVGMSLVMIGHNLERIADLSCNIAEDVIYIKQGKEVRHHFQTP